MDPPRAGGREPPRGGSGSGGIGGRYPEPPRAGVTPPTRGDGGGGGGGGGPILAPGDIDNPAPPTMACPICGKDNFKTQTELEMHSAQCQI